jgi:hypothetical protein
LEMGSLGSLFGVAAPAYRCQYIESHVPFDMNKIWRATCGAEVHVFRMSSGAHEDLHSGCDFFAWVAS